MALRIGGGEENGFVAEVLIELGDFVESVLEFWSDSGGLAVGPPVAEDVAMLQFVAQDGERLLHHVAIVRSCDVDGGRVREKRQKMAVGARCGEGYILVQLGSELRQFGKQARVFVEVFRPRRCRRICGSLGIRGRWRVPSSLLRLGRRAGENADDHGECTNDEITTESLGGWCHSHVISFLRLRLMKEMFFGAFMQL